MFVERFWYWTVFGTLWKILVCTKRCWSFDTQPYFKVVSLALAHLICMYSRGDSSHITCAANIQCIQPGWGDFYDIIQGTEEWKGAGTKFIQEVGTFWCIHFNIDAHTDTSHQRPVPHLETITLMFDLTCLHKVNSANFFMCLLQRQRWPWHSGCGEMMCN